MLRGMCGCSEGCVDLQSASTGALLSSGDLPLADALLASLLGSSPKKKKIMEGRRPCRALGGSSQHTWVILRVLPVPAVPAPAQHFGPWISRLAANSGSCHRPGTAAVNSVCNCPPQLLRTAPPVVPAGQQLAQRAGEHSTARPHPHSTRWPCFSRGLDQVASGGPGQPQPQPGCSSKHQPWL